MRILIGSINAWHNSNAIGNTLSNWFDSQENMVFSNLYSRSEMPSNNVCTDYFRITETQMLKNLFSKEKNGYHFNYDARKGNSTTPNTAKHENSIINIIKKYNLSLVYALSQSLGNSNLWINNKLKEYISNYSPDIFFSFAEKPIILRKRIETIKSLCKNCKVVLFVADDVYTVFKQSTLPRKKQLVSDFDWCIANADLVYGASDELCKEYKSIFSRDFKLLCKGCDVKDVKEKNNEVISLVYAGNLFYGRDKTLCELVNAIEKVNSLGNKKMRLEIYTASPVSEESSKILNTDGASKIVGPKPYSEVVEKMHNADIVLHVESFEEDEIQKVRLSYSTKIIDCLQSGSCPLAIGPDGIASINYFKKVDGAITVTNTRCLTDILADLVKSPSKIYDNALLCNAYAKKYHDINTVRERINSDFIDLLKD